MAKLDPLEIFTFIVRMAPAILFILFMMLIFFSLKVELRDESMERFTLELSDSITSSPLTDYKAVFNPEKLTETEAADPNRNIELYSRGCDYGYTLQVESLVDSLVCSSDANCREFCDSVCGVGSECSCSGIFTSNCQCKKFDEWHDNYEWEYGYSSYRPLAEVSSDFPVAISYQNTMLPAEMRITAYDSLVTRLSCLVQKANELKENQSVSFKKSDVYFTGSPSFRRAEGTHVCLYSLNPSGEVPIDCRYLPDITFERFDIFSDFPASKDKGIITAYPLKSTATCDQIKSNPSLVAGEDDQVATVLLCMEAKG